MIGATRLRTGETSRSQGANLRGQKLPQYVLVNMGNGKVAFGRPTDFGNPAAAAQIPNRDSLTPLEPFVDITALKGVSGLYDLQYALSEQGKAKFGALNDDWRTAQVPVDDLNPEVLAIEARLNDPGNETHFFQNTGCQQSPAPARVGSYELALRWSIMDGQPSVVTELTLDPPSTALTRTGAKEEPK